MRITRLVVLATICGCVKPAARVASSTTSSAADVRAVIHGFKSGLVGVHANSPSVKLNVGSDSALGVDPVLVVEYPAAGSDPASRDVRLDAEKTNWSIASALSFRVKPTRAIRLSVSFVDRNRVAYTWWSSLRADAWQTVRVDFTAIRPNPYFQPPGANVEAPINLTKVDGLGFAPQDPAAGRLMIGQIALVK